VDIITQGIIGAAAAQCGAKPQRLRTAALAGAVAGLLPDIDVVIRSPADPLLFLEYHRHFTHSLIFVPIGALIAAAITRLLTRKRESIRSLFLPSLLGVATHGVLDACTSYGTHLLWPFTDSRTAWHLIAIIDPLFTLSLIAGVGIATWKLRRGAAMAGLGVALAYMGLCSIQHARVQDAHAALMADRGHQGTQAQVKPAIATNILYRTFYTHQGRYFVDAIRVPWFGSSRVYVGDSMPVLDLEAYKQQHELSDTHRSDIDRFAFFSSGYVIEDPAHPGMLSDFRYAALPDAIHPLWGIEVLDTPASQHLRFKRTSSLDAAERAHFMDMLLGR